MSEPPREEERGLGPARPLVGYQETGEEESRYSRHAVIRGWVILAILAALYLGWTLIVYFLEPGLR
ncbi:MAG: hypothetical protein E6F97_00100 [Actinobacteria bacterium]|nr:MAG: hypothetical protein E6F97_00100 [Actinomycetota bacterium]